MKEKIRFIKMLKKLPVEKQKEIYLMLKGAKVIAGKGE